MTIAKHKIRKEVHLPQDIFDLLQAQADKEKRTLKNYMEFILIKQSETKK